MRTNIKIVQNAIARHGAISFGGREVIKVWTHGSYWRFTARNEDMSVKIREITKSAAKTRMTQIAAKRLEQGELREGEIARLMGRD